MSTDYNQVVEVFLPYDVHLEYISVSSNYRVGEPMVSALSDGQSRLTTSYQTFNVYTEPKPEEARSPSPPIIKVEIPMEPSLGPVCYLRFSETTN